MTARICGLLGAAMVVLLSCGPSKDEAMKLKEGSNLDDIVECPALVCLQEEQFCAEVLFEYGRAPPLCVTNNICERFDCLEEGRRCVFFDGVPIQVRCIEDD